MKIRNLLSMLVLITLFSVVALAQEDSGTKLSATLTGAAEVPGPGDTDGTGTVEIRLNQGQNQVCFELTVANIATTTAAHIHRGGADVAGPVVVGLNPPPASGSSSGCVTAIAELIKEIRQNPENFYVNVHNAPLPDGAVCGQLGKKME